MFRLFTIYALITSVAVVLSVRERGFDRLTVPEPEAEKELALSVSHKIVEPENEAVSEAEDKTKIPQEEPSTKQELYEVEKVIDGDTIVVNINGKNETIRLIGVDTPETVHPSKPVQCFGKEASRQTSSWLTGEKVYLEKDPSQGERDKYDRLLAYVYREDGMFINKELVAKGYAYEYTYSQPYKYQAAFKAAEQSARIGKLGLWADDACRGAFTQPIPPRVSNAADPIYPVGHEDKDCSDFATHASAQAYFEAGGGSAAVNYDRLDNDHDGLACESLP